MKGGFEEHGDEPKSVDVIAGAQMVDLLMFPHRRVTAEDFKLIVGLIDETCHENSGDNLNIDKIPE